MTHTPTFHFSITQFAVKNWPGVSGFTPRTLFTRIAVCAIPNCDSELFGHVFKTHKSNPIIRVYELANLFNCRHSKNRIFEFVCQYFESPKLIQFRTHRQNVSISPLVCVKMGFSPAIVVSNVYARGMPHAVVKT
jgi:hypothetical protein